MNDKENKDTEELKPNKVTILSEPTNADQTDPEQNMETIDLSDDETQELLAEIVAYNASSPRKKQLVFDRHTGKMRQRTITRTGPKVGRNDLCPCGSKQKYKRCCDGN